mmetsp:Transcript_7402/g.23691  ORF Transcript_7402/g.23691 Transcript_7402/m.23691 type:complete len:460 (-) Transcript_7402:239-1618(-)
MWPPDPARASRLRRSRTGHRRPTAPRAPRLTRCGRGCCRGATWSTPRPRRRRSSRSCSGFAGILTTTTLMPLATSRPPTPTWPSSSSASPRSSALCRAPPPSTGSWPRTPSRRTNRRPPPHRTCIPAGWAPCPASTRAAGPGSPLCRWAHCLGSPSANSFGRCSAGSSSPRSRPPPWAPPPRPRSSRRPPDGRRLPLSSTAKTRAPRLCAGCRCSRARPQCRTRCAAFRRPVGGPMRRRRLCGVTARRATRERRSQSRRRRRPAYLATPRANRLRAASPALPPTARAGWSTTTRLVAWIRPARARHAECGRATARGARSPPPPPQARRPAGGMGVRAGFCRRRTSSTWPSSTARPCGATPPRCPATCTCKVALSPKRVPPGHGRPASRRRRPSRRMSRRRHPWPPPRRRTPSSICTRLASGARTPRGSRPRTRRWRHSRLPGHGALQTFDSTFYMDLFL